MANIGISALRDAKEQTGIGHHISQLVASLQKIDKKNNYFVYICQDVYDKYEFQPEAGNFNKIKVPINTNRSILKMLWTIFCLPVRLRKDKIDLMHFPAFTFYFFMGRPTILTLHDIAEFRGATQRYSLPRVVFRKIAHPIVARVATKILTVSEYTKSEIVRYLKVEDKKIEVTYNGVSRNFRVLNKFECIEKIKVKYAINKPFLLYVSRLHHPSKNHVGLIKAFNKLKKEKNIEHKLVFIGPRTKNDSEIFQAIEEFKLKGEVIYVGYVPDMDMPLFFNAADLFVCPSLFEGFGMPIIEAMACGTPVVASNATSIPEVVENAAILFNPHNTDEIKDAIYTVIIDNSLKKDLIEKGLKRAKNFSWLCTASKTLGVYRKNIK